MKKPHTYQRALIFVLLSLLLLALTANVIAQDGSNDHNPCLNGTWTCSDSDPDRAAWNWACGWYWGHYYVGQYTASQIPDWCNPPADSDGDGIGDDLDLCPYEGGNVDANGCPIVAPPPGGPPPIGIAGCYLTTFGQYLYLTGFDMGPAPQTFYSNSSCSLVVATYWEALVWAPDQTTAAGKCLGNFWGASAVDATAFFPAISADLWYCVFF